MAMSIFADQQLAISTLLYENTSNKSEHHPHFHFGWSTHLGKFYEQLLAIPVMPHSSARLLS